MKGLFPYVFALFIFSSPFAFACSEDLLFKTRAICDSNYAQVKKLAEEVNSTYASPKLAGNGVAALEISACSKCLAPWSGCGAYVRVKIYDPRTSGQMHAPGSGCAELLNRFREKKFGDGVVEESKDARSVPRPSAPREIAPSGQGRAEDSKAL
ncbi:MAG TPA: hypothetical protein VM598_14545 [Bdellovibrionota bacterium]|nr:hypothetical protein [Bdellovibrionota bacterium]